MRQLKKLYITLRLWAIPTAAKRADYLRKKKLFGEIGQGVLMQPRKFPLHAKLIHIHNNVTIAARVEFITHDIIFKVLNQSGMFQETFAERVGPIEIMDNVFIGSGTQIMYNTRIGSNVIIGAGSLVNKDIPDNSVYAGVPARFICTFDEYLDKAREYQEWFSKNFHRPGLSGVSDQLAQEMYLDFCQQRDGGSSH